MANQSRSTMPPCDLVMKGGITSGIVYPPALQELAKKYRFERIGGTSAGAIAAACAAAAEFGSETGKPHSGFEGFREISDWLGQDSNLLGLFQPSASTRPLFKTFLVMAAPGPGGTAPGFVVLALRTLGRLTGALVRYDPGGFLIGAVIGALLATLLRWLTLSGTSARQLLPPFGWPTLWAILAVLFCAWLGGLISGIVGLFRIVQQRVPANFFGMCTGRADAPSPSASAAPALTDWLHQKIQELGGLAPADQPLTFGALRQKGIRLSMVTTNLSQGQPFDLPFATSEWIFNEGEMRQLFPDAIVRHLIDKGHQGPRVSLKALPEYHYLPDTDDLPVAFAMRMSLSFPVLISAVPLYTVKRSAYRALDKDGVVTLKDAATDLDKNWFSDGGISSNFPIHFFDDWLPTSPTFGINLRSMPPERSRAHAASMTADADQGARKSRVQTAMNGQVFLPGPNAPQYPELEPLPKLTDFLGAIWNTAQNYHDNTQAMLPSYRERIVNVRFSDSEGGLNLTMGPDKVKDVQDKGAAAGAMLRDGFDLKTHQWVRFQVLMPELERHLKQMKTVLSSAPYQGFLKKLEEGSAPPEVEGATAVAPDQEGAIPYDRSPQWRSEAAKRVERLIEQMEQWEAFDREWLKEHAWGDECFFTYRCPKPQPVLRMAPKL